MSSTPLIHGVARQASSQAGGVDGIAPERSAGELLRILVVFGEFQAHESSEPLGGELDGLRDWVLGDVSEPRVRTQALELREGGLNRAGRRPLVRSEVLERRLRVRDDVTPKARPRRPAARR